MAPQQSAIRRIDIFRVARLMPIQTLEGASAPSLQLSRAIRRLA
jgi:hypothetical protein